MSRTDAVCPSQRLVGKTAIVFGGGSVGGQINNGLAAALAYAAASANVFVVDLSPAAVEGAVEARANAAVAAAADADRLAHDERERARALWRRVSATLDAAETDLVRWPSQQVWLTRLDSLRSYRDDQTSS